MPVSKAKAKAAHQGTTVAAAWLSPAEAAIYLSISLNHFYSHVMDHVEARKLGQRTSISRESLDKYMASRERVPKAGQRRIRRQSDPDDPQRSKVLDTLKDLKKKAAPKGGRATIRSYYPAR